MTDSVNVFPAGMRLTDNDTGAPLEGATIYFYDAGTTTPKTVYSDADLTVPIGTSVVTDALGYPTTNGTTRTLVYTGTAPYKIIIKDNSGVTVSEHDNIKGAATTFDQSALNVNATKPVVVISANYTIVKEDQNKILAVNCSGGNITLTLPSAVTVGSGWPITIQHAPLTSAGTTNTVTISSTLSQTITSGATSLGTSTVLAFNGQELTLVSDGSNWRVVSYIKNINLFTEKATTSGTTVLFTGIPSWVERITLLFNGVSSATGSTSDKLVQLGSGSIQNTGYLGASSYILASTVASSNSTSGFRIKAADPADVIHGTMTLTLLKPNLWIASGVFAFSNTAGTITTAGSVSLTAGALDRVQLNSVNGTDVFDAGSITAIYE